MNTAERQNWDYFDVGTKDGNPLPILMGHRGVHGLCAAIAFGKAIEENSEAAFQAAKDLGLTHIEADASAIKKKVIFEHGADDEKEREENGRPTRSKLRTMEWAHVQREHPGSMLVEDALDKGTFPGMRWNIDLKDEFTVEGVVNAIQRTNAYNRVCLASFRRRNVDEAVRLLGGPNVLCTSGGPALGVAAKIGGLVASRAFENTDAACVQWPFDQKVPILGTTVHATEAMVRRANKYGLPVHFWVLNEEGQMVRALNWGALGIISDRPDIGINVFKQRGFWSLAA